MICFKCKQENTEESKYCSDCGASLQNEIMNKIPKNKVNKKILIGIISLVLVLSAGVFTYFYVNNPLKQFEKAVQEYKLAIASDIYNSDIKGNKSKEESAIALLVDEVQYIKKQFKDDNISYKTVMERLDDVEEMEIVNKQVTKARKEINTLNNSRNAFSAGKKLLESKNYADALSKFEMVKEVDSNYKKAQELIDESGKLYKDETLKNAEMYVVKEDYESAVTLIEEALLLLNDDIDLTKHHNIYEEQLKVQKQQEIQEQERLEQQRQERERLEQQKQREQQELVAKKNELYDALAKERAKRETFVSHSQNYRDSLNREIKILQELQNLIK